MSTSTEYIDGLNAPAERRFYSRVTPPTPIYVAFGSNNLGVLHNVSENGFQVTTPSELPLNSVFRVFLSLNGAPKTIAVTVRTIWTDRSGNRSGIQLLDLVDEDRQQIRDWVELELSRNENSTPWFLPKSGNQTQTKAPSENWHETRQALGDVRATDEQSFSEAPSQQAPVVPPVSQAAPEPIPAPRAATPPVTTPLGDEARAARVQDRGATREQDTKTAAPNRAAETNTELPHIANPFEDPGPNSQFEQFPSVPLPIHREFEYAKTPSKQRRRAATLSSHMRTKPLLLWAAVLAVVCFGANALVRYKIKLNAQRFASESARYTPPKSDAAADNSDPAENSGASATETSSTDSQSAANSNGDANSKDQATSRTPVNTPTTTAQNESSLPSAPPASHSAAKKSDASQVAPRQESSLGARDNSAYAATAPPVSRRFEETAPVSQPAATPRTWTAPAPSRSASSNTSVSEAPQSPNVAPNVTSTANNAQPQPNFPQTRPTPPPAPAAQSPSTGNTSNSVQTSNSNGTAINTQGRTQQPTNTQSTYASNTNTTPSRQQSPIYNANGPQQRSAVMGSINSVHSSGIFDSNDTTTASAAPPAASRGSNANVATRPVSNSTVVSSDTPQEHDVEIVAPKGFGASYVDVPGERVVRSAAGTVHIRRTVRVPGERIPGQRWLWKGKLDVTLGDVVSRIDPAVVQSAGASGSLTVQATIDKDGYVTDLKPLYGNFAMLPAVSRTVRNWRYDPTYLDNKRVETTAQVEFDLNAVAATSRSGRP
jgi:hypothetical protein